MACERSPYVYCPYCRAEMTDRFVFGRTRRACPACGFIHFVDPKVGAAMLAERDGQVVLVRRAVAPSVGSWCLPAGFVEYGESPADTAVRECLEETGLHTQIAELLHVDQYTDDPRGSGVIVFYRGQVVGGRMEPGDDADQVRLFGPCDLPEDIAFPSNRHVLIRWQHARLPLPASGL
jgi:8-oxo-dGTP diphosphatase